MLKKKAKEITGGLSQTMKMPCSSYSVVCPRWDTESECDFCYARKGNYTRYPNVAKALENRTKSIYHPQWIDAMITLIKGKPYFRWHDAGDLHGLTHFGSIVAVAKGTPKTKHWLPTKLPYVVARFVDIWGPLPQNLTIRLSCGDKPRNLVEYPILGVSCTSTTHTTAPPGFECPANPDCGKCRACWDSRVENVSYKLH